MALRDVLAEHFVMWHDADGRVGGEWRCACGTKFGFSDSAIDHQAAAIGLWTTTDESITRFRSAWEDADAAGVRGSRVHAGLTALLGGEDPKPTHTTRYWLTPAGCDATGGHLVHCEGCEACLACGTSLTGANA
jgi:hypothetical protein